VARLGASLSAAIAACVAIALAVDRAPTLFGSTWATVSVLGAEKLDRARDWAQREVPVDGLYRARDWVQREIGAARAAWTASAGVPVVVAAADPPILVSVNSDPWSNVEVDGVAAGATPLTIELLPGPHAFRAELADGRVLERVVHVSPDLDRISFR
jgi:hypothetical protein